MQKVKIYKSVSAKSSETWCLLVSQCWLISGTLNIWKIWFSDTNLVERLWNSQSLMMLQTIYQLQVIFTFMIINEVIENDS